MFVPRTLFLDRMLCVFYSPTYFISVNTVSMMLKFRPVRYYLHIINGLACVCVSVSVRAHELLYVFKRVLPYLLEFLRVCVSEHYAPVSGVCVSS